MEELYGKTRYDHIPEELRPCFWDSDFDSLDLRKNMLFIISRLYTKGGIRGKIFVEKCYSIDDIRAVAKVRRDFTPQVATYLMRKCGLQRNEMAFFRMMDLKGRIPWNEVDKDILPTDKGGNVYDPCYRGG